MRRQGAGILVGLAVCMPVVLLASGVALSLQSSSARRFSSSLWASYTAMELAESAVAEAAHFLKPEDVFAPDRFPCPEGADFTVHLLGQLLRNELGGVDEELKEYRRIRRIGDGSEARKMLVGFRFPPAARPVKGKGLVRKLAAETRGVRVDGADDLVVEAHPLTFRREYYRNRTNQGAADPAGHWINWGVIQFRVKVRTEDLRGLVTHELVVDRRFKLTAPETPDSERLKVSSLNLRVFAGQEGSR